MSETGFHWEPTSDIVKSANITQFMNQLSIHDVQTFHRWSVDHIEDFWRRVTEQLGIVFKQPATAICDLSRGASSPRWFPGAKMNIADSCFTANSDETAILYLDEQKNICRISYQALNELSNRIANSLVALGFTAGDAIAIVMPMNYYAVAIYLAIIKMGGVVVSIADSFSSDEIALRLRIGNTKAVFTQDCILRNGKRLALYEKIQQAKAPVTIVLPSPQPSPSSPHAFSGDLPLIRWGSPLKACGDDGVVRYGDDGRELTLRDGDHHWQSFLQDNTTFVSYACDPMSACNILFSSGTTGEPKAIVWNHTTAIRAASDAFFHQNIQPRDVMTWPSNLGWMMGPWLIYAALINHATIALYTDAPKDRAFGEFVQRAQVTMLGVIPTLVATWHQTQCMENLDWHAIKVFTSTGECSNASDMAYLMSLAGNKPVIEYCGGTEIGGAYLSSTVVQPNFPSLFSTPAMGTDIVILDEQGHYTNEGEVAIVSPSIGLSTTLLNADHEKIYFDHMPSTPDGKILRRHGDQIKQLANGYYTILGRADDTMNLSGIKISAAEIERALVGIPHIHEVAAVAVTPPNHGPSLLVIYAATAEALDKTSVLHIMQKKISELINPLFKIHDVIFVRELPKTASNKIMRRLLRSQHTDMAANK